jgi:hypothetical protein
MLLGMLTPVYGRVAATMIDSLRNETVVRDAAAREAFAVTPRGLPEAIRGALMSEDDEFAQLSWSDVLAPNQGARWGGTPMSRRLVTSRVERVDASPSEVFARVQRIGGTRGWYGTDWFWTLRGALDKLRGGNGMRRGRRDPHELRTGDAIDFWRVVRIEPDHGLLLTAEMKMPGRLWLDYEVTSKDGHTVLRQTTVFDPAGYAGLAYWYLLYPVHRAIFTAMLHGLGHVTGTDDHQPTDAGRGESGPQESRRDDVRLLIVDRGKDRESGAFSLTDLAKAPRTGVNPLSRPAERQPAVRSRTLSLAAIHRHRPGDSLQRSTEREDRHRDQPERYPTGDL